MNDKTVWQHIRTSHAAANNHGCCDGVRRLALVSTKAWAEAREEISHTAESIHQEVVFKASRNRVYEALTDAKSSTTRRAAQCELRRRHVNLSRYVRKRIICA